MGGNPAGEYAGKDKKGGANWSADQIKEDKDRAILNWETNPSRKYTPQARFGIGQKLEDLGVEWGFDAMNKGSMAEALMRRDFIKDVKDQTAGGYNEDEAVWGYADAAAGERESWLRPNPEYASLGQQDIEDYWQDWKGGKSSDYENLVESAGITDEQFNRLDPGHSAWRKMENPMIGEATDVTRGSIGSIMSGLGGDIRTGSAARRRQEAFQDFGQHMTDIKGKSRQARSKESDRLAGKIQKLFS